MHPSKNDKQNYWKPILDEAWVVCILTLETCLMFAVNQPNKNVKCKFSPRCKTLPALIVLIRADEEGKFSNEDGKLFHTSSLVQTQKM